MKKKRYLKWEKQSLTTVLYPVIFGILLLILWQTQLLHKMLGADTFALPLPGRILNIILDNGPAIRKNVTATVIVAAGGLFFGSVFGYFLGIIATVFPKWGAGG